MLDRVFDFVGQRCFCASQRARKGPAGSPPRPPPSYRNAPRGTDGQAYRTPLTNNPDGADSGRVQHDAVARHARGDAAPPVYQPRVRGGLEVRLPGLGLVRHRDEGERAGGAGE
eukprot:gene3097-biopygen8238